MGKSSNKERSSVEYFKSIIRQLKKQIKQLQQQINKLTNNVGLPDSLGDELEEPIDVCSKCGKGILKELIIANRLFYTCNICDFRSKSTKIDKSKP